MYHRQSGGNLRKKSKPVLSSDDLSVNKYHYLTTALNFCPNMRRHNTGTRKYCFKFRESLSLEKSLQHIEVDIFWNAGCIMDSPSTIPVWTANKMLCGLPNPILEREWLNHGNELVDKWHTFLRVLKVGYPSHFVPSDFSPRQGFEWMTEKNLIAY